MNLLLPVLTAPSLVLPPGGRAIALHHGAHRLSSSPMMMSDPNEVLPSDRPLREPARNVIGTELQCCCADVHGSGIGTGFYRDGFCSTGPQDEGLRTGCGAQGQGWGWVSLALIFKHYFIFSHCMHMLHVYAYMLPIVHVSEGVGMQETDF